MTQRTLTRPAHREYEVRENIAAQHTHRHTHTQLDRPPLHSTPQLSIIYSSAINICANEIFKNHFKFVFVYQLVGSFDLL
jgi:hypothetical protein